MRGRCAKVTRERAIAANSPLIWPCGATCSPSGATRHLPRTGGVCPSGEGREALYNLTPRKIPLQNLPPRFAVLRHYLCAVLAQADAVAVAVGGENKRILPGVIRHGERRAPQTERTAQTCARKHLPADGHLRHIARAVQHALAEPPGGGVWYLVGVQAKPGQDRVYLLGAVGDGRFEPRRIGVPRRRDTL